MSDEFVPQEVESEFNQTEEAEETEKKPAAPQATTPEGTTPLANYCGDSAGIHLSEEVAAWLDAIQAEDERFETSARLCYGLQVSRQIAGNKCRLLSFNVYGRNERFMAAKKDGDVWVVSAINLERIMPPTVPS